MNFYGDDSLEQRVAALERRSLGGGVYGTPGVSTAFGAATTVFRHHFPAELTSSYSTSTGYSWKRLMLDRSASSPAFAAADNPDAGSYAFTPDDDRGLVSGDKGYLFADATAGGWVFVKGAGGAGAAVDCAGGCGSLTGILDDWCLKLSLVCATGEFANMGTAQFDAVYAFGSAGTWRFKTWVDGSPGSWQDFSFEWYTGSTGVPVLTFATDGTPVLTIDATVDKTMRSSCVGSSATFVGGVQNGFDGDATIRAALEECASNDFVLKVECSCCPIDGWEGGDKWYCIEDTGPTDCIAVYLLEEDKCDDTIIICSGPYDTEAEAEAVCPPPVTVQTACCADPIRETLNWTLSGLSGTCSPGSPASGTVTYNSGTGKWESVTFAYLLGNCEEGATYDLECVGGVWTFQGAATVTCPEPGPLSIAFTKTINGGTYTITFTE
jgi:hypothetical protein